MKHDELIALVLSSFEAERSGDVQGGLNLVSDDFKVTEMSLGNRGDTLFPSTTQEEARKFINQVYKIEGRKYQFVNVVADVDKQVVLVEFVESYSDTETNQLYRTPQVAVCEIKNGKIWRTRHYNDPRVSFVGAKQVDIDRALS